MNTQNTLSLHKGNLTSSPNSLKNRNEKGHVINEVNEEELNILQVAVQGNDLETTSSLLENKVDINYSHNGQNVIDCINSKEMITLFDNYFTDMNYESQKSFYFKRIEYLN